MLYSLSTVDLSAFVLGLPLLFRAICKQGKIVLYFCALCDSVSKAVRVGKPSFEEREKTGEADMILYTAGLVTIAADKTAVRIQLSLHEYLKNQGQQWFPEAELEIAERLLTYLNNESMTRTCSSELDNNV